MLERGAVEILHGDEGFAILFTDVVNGADVGVVESGGSLGFALEASEGLGIFGDVVREKFQCHVAMKSCVQGFVNHTHSAAAKLFHDAVVR